MVSVLVVFLYQKISETLIFLIITIPLLLVYSLKFYLLRRLDLKLN